MRTHTTEQPTTRLPRSVVPESFAGHIASAWRHGVRAWQGAARTWVVPLQPHVPPAALALVALLTSLAPAPSDAHVVLDQRTAAPGGFYRGAFRVGHGCEGAATVAITVHLPAGVRAAKPMPKAGWTIERRLEPLPEAYTSHGRTVSEDVVAITWRGGPLPDAHFDEFVVQMQLPDTPGALWFKVLQRCEQGENDWSMVPASGTSTRGLKTPAALLQVVAPMVAPVAPSVPKAGEPSVQNTTADEHKH